MSTPLAFGIISFNDHTFDPLSNYRAAFRMKDGTWQSSAAVGLIARRNATPDSDMQSINATTLPPLHVNIADDATISAETFWNTVQEWFAVDGNRNGLRYLHRWHHDGVNLRQVRIGCYVAAVEWDKRSLTHFVISLIAPGGWEDADASVRTDPDRISNFGSRATHPTLTLTTTTHKFGRICTVTGIDAINYRVRFALNDTAATSTNVHVYINGVLSESYVTGSGLITSAVWAKVDVARDAYTVVVIVYGSGLSNPRSQTLDDGGIDFATATNSVIVWDDISVSGQPGDALCWQLAKSGSDGGASGGSYELTAESNTSLTFTRYTDGTGDGDADSIALSVPSGLTTLTHVGRATTNHDGPTATIATTTGGGGGSNEVQSIALAHVTGGSFPLTFAGKATVTVTTIQQGDPLGGAHEIQEVTILGNPTGGTFTLTYDGQTTAGIAYNASLAAVQSALEALSNIAPGDVALSGGPLPTSRFRVEFTGTLAATNVAEMTASAASLTTTAQTTAQIAWNADSAAVAAALSALPNLAGSVVSVTGGPLPTSPISVEFVGALANTNVSQMTTDNTALLGAGARSYVRGWIAGSQKPTTAWSAVADGSTAASLSLNGAQRVAMGIEYTTPTPQTGATLVLSKSGGSWTGTLTNPPTVVVGTVVNLDYYDGDVQIGDAETMTFGDGTLGYLVPDGELVIDCEARTITPADTSIVPIGMLDTDPDVWLSLEPGNQAVTNTTDAAIEWQYRSGWS